MRRKDLIFCIIVVAAVYFFRKIPLHLVFEEMGFGTYSSKIKSVVFGLLIIGAGIIIAKQKKILQYGGFIKPDRRNFWMLLIPLFFPGLLFATDLELNCLNAIKPILMAVTLIFVSALMEEIVFRGVIQGYLRAKYPEKSRNSICVITAVFFALVHLTNVEYFDLEGVLQQVVYAFFIGLLFSALLYRTNSIWLLGLLHGLLNFLSYRCDDEIIIGQHTETVSYQISLAGLANIGGVILLLSPVLFIYWLLLKTMKAQSP